MTYSSEISKLIAEGSRAYSGKDYHVASEKYAEACEKFSAEQDDEDADLLLLYGKALFQNAVSKSDVFGGAKSDDQGVEKKVDKPEEKREDDGNFQFYDAAPLAEEGGDDVADDEVEGNDAIPAEEEGVEGDEELQEKHNDEEEEEEQSDFEIAWEILDLTRSLFENKVEDNEALSKDLVVPYVKGSEEPTNEYIITLRKLSETYDLLGEVSLEAGNFPQAVGDFESSLELRLKLFDPKMSTLISESHYKLSLALEFSVDEEDLRKKAADQMKLAIKSVEIRNTVEKDAAKKKENEELIEDLIVRYEDLKKDPTEEIELEQLEMIKGILGEPSASASGSKTSDPLSAVAASMNDMTPIVKKKAPVNDLTSMVKKRKPLGKVPVKHPGATKKQKK